MGIPSLSRKLAPPGVKSAHEITSEQLPNLGRAHGSSGACNLQCSVKPQGIQPRTGIHILIKGGNKMKTSTKDEVAGKVHEVKGKVKEKAGQVTNNPDLEAEGQDEKIGGKVQKKIGQVEKILGK